MKTKKKSLACSCCGKSFQGLQHVQHDKGYGTCLACCQWIAKNWPFDEIYNNEYKTNNVKEQVIA